MMFTLHIVSFDVELFQFINGGLSNGLFDAILPVFRNKLTWIPLYLLVAFLLWRNKGRQGLVILLFLIISVAFADIVSSHLLKPLFHRLRPCQNPALSDSIRLVLQHCSGAFSFPSSHASNHFALGLFLGLVFRKEKPIILYLGILWAAIISFAQVYVGVHYPSDVFGGMLVGLFVSILNYYVYRKVIKKHFL